MVVGIKFSKLTNEEFSPRKLSGVFRILFNSILLLLSFHGFVFEGIGAADVDDELPKKSPNGSLTVCNGGATAGVGEVTRLFENNSKSSKSLLFDLLVVVVVDLGNVI